MKQKKTMMVLALIMASSLFMMPLVVQAKQNGFSYSNANVNGAKLQNQIMKTSLAPLHVNSIIRPIPKTPQAYSNIKHKISKLSHFTEEIQVEEIDEEVLAEINTLAVEYEAIPEDERPTIPGVWIVTARGLSWKPNTVSETSEVAPECVFMGTRFYAKAILGTPEWTLYRLGRGIVGHNGERYKVDGYALYKKETGKFYLVLDGEGVSLQAVGKVYGPHADLAAYQNCRCLRVAMKGRIKVEGEDWVFALRGIAHRRWFHRALAINDADVTDSS